MAYLAVCLVFALAGGLIGRSKGSSFFIWFLISGVVPVLGLIAALLYRYESDEPLRQCPTCGRVTKISDAICTRCGTELDFPDEVLAAVRPPRTHP